MMEKLPTPAQGHEGAEPPADTLAAGARSPAQVADAQLELEARVRTLERELDDRREREQELWLQFRNHRREIARLEAERADLVATLKQARDIAESLRVQLARANAMVMAATKAMDSHVAMSESIARETAQKARELAQQIATLCGTGRAASAPMITKAR